MDLSIVLTADLLAMQQAINDVVECEEAFMEAPSGTDEELRTQFDLGEAITALRDLPPIRVVEAIQ